MEIKYDIIRTDRGTVGITVRDGLVTVRAPRSVSDGEIRLIVEKHREWIEKKLLQSKGAVKPSLSEGDIAILRALAKKYLPSRLEYFSRLTGLSPERVRISSAKSRFGSCTSSGSISLSLYVMLYPREAIDLVIVHELCHLRHMNHSKSFYALLSRFLPDHKARKALLRSGNEKTMDEIMETYGDLL